MKMTAEQFLNWEHKSITLLAMSGAGKTTLAKKLPTNKWYHYSGDYRIGTRYLSESILDNIKREAMNVPFLRNLLRSDSIRIDNNITTDNLMAVSSFLGKLGNKNRGGLSLELFKYRQKLHHQAEISAMLDVPKFIHQANDIYRYPYFLNDAGGSVCELDSPEVLECLAEHTLIIYIKIPKDREETIIERAKSHPKPLYYREAFLDEQLADYLTIHGLTDSEQIVPDEFVSWVFPQLFSSRLPRYQAIADKYGYTLDGNAVENISNENEFMQLIADAISVQSPEKLLCL